MKRISLIVIIVLLTLSLSACACEHEWQDANCLNPQVCSLCKETQGEALGHEWSEAACTTPKTCLLCSETEGEALGHEWIDATCETPKICKICAKTNDEPLGHTEGDYITTKEATLESVGEKQISCTQCDKVINTEMVFYYDITPDEIKYYTNALDTYYSLQAIHINPDSFELLGAVANTSTNRTTIYLSYRGNDGTVYTDYLWKEVGINKEAITNRFGYDNYVGTGSPAEPLDLTELWYFEKYSGYTPTISPDSEIELSW